MACTKGHRNNKTKKTRFIKKGDYIMDIIKSIEHEQMKSKIPYLKVGDTVKVKVYEIDSQGRINLSMKDLETSNKEE